MHVWESEARAALVQNAHFLEQWYTLHQSFKASATAWPVLPVKATRYFRIQFLAHPSSTPAGKFRLYACPRSGGLELSRYLVIDQDGIVKLCSRARALRRCTLY